MNYVFGGGKPQPPQYPQQPTPPQYNQPQQPTIQIETLQKKVDFPLFSPKTNAENSPKSSQC